MAPYPWWDLPVVLGTIGGIGLIFGPLGLMIAKLRRDPVMQDEQRFGMDFAFLAMLFLTSLTGLLLLVLRATPAMPLLLALHLGVVFALFITMPYGKFVHGIYRFVALVRYAQGASGLRRQGLSHAIDHSRQRHLQGHVRHAGDAGGVLRRQSAQMLRRGRGRARGRAGAHRRHSAEAADAIARLAPAVVLDRARAEAAMPRTSAIRSLGLVRQLSGKLGEAGRYVHWGATTQDIVDTATVLQIRAGLAIVERDIAAVSAALARLAEKHRDTPMAGRTHLQQALPITFGYKCAVWLSMMDRHAERLRELKPRVLVAQLGGAAGTLASLGDKGLEVRREYARELGLGRPPDHLACGARRRCRNRAVPRARHRLARQDRLRHHAA